MSDMLKITFRNMKYAILKEEEALENEIKINFFVASRSRLREDEITNSMNITRYQVAPRYPVMTVNYPVKQQCRNPIIKLPQQNGITKGNILNTTMIANLITEN